MRCIVSYAEIKKLAAAELQSAGIEEYEVDAEYLLQYASGLERNELFIRWNEEVPRDIEEKYRHLIDRRKSHEPLQYIIGNQDFMGYTFMVTPDVLIPRFDTEILAELAIRRAWEDISAVRNITVNSLTNDQWIQSIPQNAISDKTVSSCVNIISDGKYRILDLCTGSGCVATSVGLSLSEKLVNSSILNNRFASHTISNGDGKELVANENKINNTEIQIYVTGADISKAAVELAKKNWELNLTNIVAQHENATTAIDHTVFTSAVNTLQSNSLGEKTGIGKQQIEATFLESDLFRNIEGRFHLITANPPYIVRDEIETLMPEITEHEPHLALDGGEDGMDFYRKIVSEAPNFLLPGGRLMMEFDDAEAESVAEMMEIAGFTDIRIHKDLAGLRRVIEGKKHVQ